MNATGVVKPNIVLRDELLKAMLSAATHDPHWGAWVWGQKPHRPQGPEREYLVTPVQGVTRIMTGAGTYPVSQDLKAAGVSPLAIVDLRLVAPELRAELQMSHAEREARRERETDRRNEALYNLALYNLEVKKAPGRLTVTAHWQKRARAAGLDRHAVMVGEYTLDAAVSISSELLAWRWGFVMAHEYDPAVYGAWNNLRALFE